MFRKMMFSNCSGENFSNIVIIHSIKLLVIVTVLDLELHDKKVFCIHEQESFLSGVTKHRYQGSISTYHGVITSLSHNFTTVTKHPTYFGLY